MPTSIFPGSIEKFGWPTAGSVHGPRPTPIERQLSIAFCAAARTSSRLPPNAALAPPTFHIRISPATPRRFSRSIGRRGADVVVGDDGLHLDAVLGGELHRHFDVHIVAGVIAVEADHASAAVGDLHRVVEALGGWRGEDLAHGHRVEHVSADIPNKGRLVAGAATRDDADLATYRRLRVRHDSRVLAELDEIAVRLDEAAHGVLNDKVWIVDKALHEREPLFSF